MTGNLKFVSFSSGSCGNCYYLGDGNDGILIDAGVSLRRLRGFLLERGLSYDSFSAVLVTHDHLDHIRHLGSYCKKLSKPVYSTPNIHSALAVHTFTREHIGSCRRLINPGEWLEIVPGVNVRPFVVPHDATETVGYAIDFKGYRFLIMTDVGRITDESVELAKESTTVVIESNYDMDMLIRGPYPKDLQERIYGGNGHISNDECASAIRRFNHPGLKNIFLCHRSDNNNTRKLAFDTSKDALRQIGAEDVALRVLPRREPTEVFNI